MNAEITLYDYAKQIIINETPMDPVNYSKAISELSDYINNHKYTMLLCNERKDFTLFHNIYFDKDKIILNLSETISNRGALLLADQQKDGAYEIWIRDLITNENYAYYLFDYGNGVVEV